MESNKSFDSKKTHHHKKTYRVPTHITNNNRSNHTKEKHILPSQS